jgi:hypothetical protein
MDTAKHGAKWYEEQAQTARQYAADAAGKGLEGMSSFHERAALAYRAEADALRAKVPARRAAR